MNESETIYVSIAAFDEIYIKPTLQSIWSNSEFPERVFVGLNYQSSDGCFDDLSNFKNLRVRYSATNLPVGFGIDRVAADSFWNCENYYLQIDAHTLFEQNWDSDLINSLHEIKISGVDKPILSTYSPWWSISKDGNIENFKPGTVDRLMVCSYVSGEPSKYWGGFEREFNKTVGVNEFVEHYTISGGFFFCESKWLEEVGHDWKYIFIGDETLIALRSCTRGYRIFSTGKPFMWHLNKPVSSIKKNWANIAYSGNFNPNSQRYKRDRNHLRRILLGEEFGFSGAPNKDSLDEYLLNIGFDANSFYEEIDKLP